MGPWEYWGKAQPPKGGRHDRWHLLPLHCLDVAAVAQRYLWRAERFRRHWAQHLGWSEEVLTDWVTFFIALHDLGKFSASFQSQCAEVLAELQDGRQVIVHQAIRHDSLGAMLWAENFTWPNTTVVEGLIGPHHEAAQSWIHATSGHHGQPPQQDGAFHDHFADRDVQAASDFVAAMMERLLPIPSRAAWRDSDPQRLEAASKTFSWWLSGLTVLADWLGSNTDYFPYRETPQDFDAYWQHALRQADQALDASGVLPQPGARAKSISELFSIPSPTPLQDLAQTLPLAAGPQLLVLEDVTGAGKTEAAVVLAHRLLVAGQVDGLYFALPTQATANQMYERLGQVYERLFAEGSRPSLVLAHSARELSEAFRASVLPADPAPEPLAGTPSGEETASQRCTAWLADKRKAALLAQVGVGTVDQALMGALHVKHQSLRLLGLFGKVLVVDEVHACDAYMVGLLKTLLAFHRQAGGSAILLSATLPRALRAELCAIYAPDESVAVTTYPLLTQAHDGALHELPVATRREVQRTVQIEWLHSVQDCHALALNAARAGGAVCWLRNTVRDAVAAYQGLRAEHEATRLFHARFALGDRLTIEAQALQQFGTRGTAADRQGQLLVATQVVEQSLDLDFDLMISDLAPIDLLIQRAGRLHRHQRGDRGAPVLYVLSPDAPADANADWLGSELRGTGRVYDSARLWLSAHQLQSQGSRWRMPDDARRMVEAVYGESSYHDLPETLRRVADSQAGIEWAARSSAQANALRLGAGYCVDAASVVNWWQDVHTPTRLGEASSTLHLLVWEGGRLRDYHAHADPLRAAGLSRLSVRSSQVDEAAEPAEAALRKALQHWRENQAIGAAWVIPVVLQADGEAWRGEALASGKRVVVKYSRAFGLSYAIADHARRAAQPHIGGEIL